jgi:purine-cytosine permease-like protein
LQIVVVAEEHFIFRKHVIRGGYDLTAYDTMSKLPIGAAGIFACACGAGMAVVSMAQVRKLRAFTATGADNAIRSGTSARSVLCLESTVATSALRCRE